MEYQNTSSEGNIERLKSELLNIHTVMKDNIDLILSRGQNLEGNIN